MRLFARADGNTLDEVSGASLGKGERVRHLGGIATLSFGDEFN